MTDLNTAEDIMAWFKKQAEEKQPLDPHQYLEGCIKLAALLQDVQERWVLKEQEVAKLRKVLLEDGKTVAYAKAMIEVSEEYKEARLLKAKLDKGTSFIQLVKLYVRTSSDLMKSNM